MLTRDRVTGGLMTILGLAVAVYAFTLPPSSTEGDVGPALFPLIAAVLLMICGIVTCVRKQEQAAPFFTAPEQVKRFLSITAVYILYGVLLWAVGFLISTPIMCFVLCVMMSGNKKTAKWKLALFSLAVTAVVYYCFQIMLSLRLPAGAILKFTL